MFHIIQYQLPLSPGMRNTVHSVPVPNIFK